MSVLVKFSWKKGCLAGKSGGGATGEDSWLEAAAGYPEILPEEMLTPVLMHC